MKKILATVYLLSVAGLLPAQTLSLDECLKLADEHYPIVAMYDLIESTEHYNLSNASKTWLPHGALSAQASWQNSATELPDVLAGIMEQQGVDYPGMRKDQYKVGIEVTQQIWDGGFSRAERSVARAATDVEHRRVDVQMHGLEERVEELYFSILLFDSRLARIAASSQLVDSILAQMRSLKANGVAMQSDCDCVEARLLSLRQQQVRMSAIRESYCRVLEIFIGRELSAVQLILPGETEIMPETYKNSSMRLFDARLSAIDAEECRLKASLMPVLGAFAGAYYGYPGYNMFKSMQSRDFSFNFMAGVKLSWNFGMLYNRGNNLKKLDLKRASVEAERSTFLFNRSIEQSESEGQIRAMREQMEQDLQIVRLCRSVREAAQSQLRNGVIDTTTLLTRITDEELAENDMAMHRIELVKALYKLNHIINQ